MHAFLLRVLSLALVLLGTLVGQAWGQQDLHAIPPLSAHVTDVSGLLSPAEQQALEARLVALEQQKGAQVAVLIVASTQPEAIEQYALRVAEQWRLGRKGVDDGLLFLIARDDRRMRIEVGRGLEGAIPDAIAKRIIADVVTPRFRAGDYAGGVNEGVAAIVAKISGEALPLPQGSPGAQAADGEMGLEEMLVLGIVVTIIAGGILKAMFGRLLGAGMVAALVGGGAWLLTSMMLIALVGAVLAFVFTLAMGGAGSGRHIGGGPWIGGPWNGGGGFGGGSGGGWSGGGGDFGGGGASGNW